MTRYIDADLLMKELGITDPDCVKCEWGSKLFPFCTRDGDFVDACDAICEAPTIDAVEVVRCKDCKHRPIKGDGNIVYAPNDIDGWDDDTCPCLCDDCYYNWMPEDDFFCGKGERREDAEVH